MQKIADNIVLLMVITTAGMIILAVSFVLLMLRDQNKILMQKQQMQFNEIAHQKTLLHAVIESQEKERRRIGQDLHDDVGSSLSNLHLILESFSRQPYSDPVFAKFKEDCKRIIAGTINDVRNISHSLSPEILTLHTTSEAIEDLCYRTNSAGEIKLTLINNAEEVLNGFELERALSVYRVLEELITNTLKHADASHVALSFHATGEGMLQVVYRDNGKGIVTDGRGKKGRGLQNIESRLGMINASYKMKTEEGGGYLMEIQVPV